MPNLKTVGGTARAARKHRSVGLHSKPAGWSYSVPVQMGNGVFSFKSVNYAFVLCWSLIRTLSSAVSLQEYIVFINHTITCWELLACIARAASFLFAGYCCIFCCLPESLCVLKQSAALGIECAAPNTADCCSVCLMVPVGGA